MTTVYVNRQVIDDHDKSMNSNGDPVEDRTGGVGTWGHLEALCLLFFPCKQEHVHVSQTRIDFCIRALAVKTDPTKEEKWMVQERDGMILRILSLP